MFFPAAALALGSWLFGQFFHPKTSRDDLCARAETFLSLFFGYLALISVYALVVTQGCSVMLLLLPPLLLFVQAPSLAKLQRQVRQFGAFLLWFTLWLTLCWLFFGGFERSHEAHADLAFYAQALEGMNRLGAENPSGARGEFFSGSGFPAPYHYGDLWGAAFLNQLFELRGLTALLVLQPFLLSLACYGFSALTGSRLGGLILPLAAGVVAPARMFADGWLFGYALPWLMYPTNLINRPKLALTMCCYLAVLLLIAKGARPWRCLACGLLAVPLTPTMWPAGLSGICLASLDWHRRSLLSRKHLAAVVLSTVGLACSLVLFYHQFGSGELVSTPPITWKTALTGLIKALTYILPNAALLALVLALGGRRNALKPFAGEGLSLIGCVWAGAALGLMLFQAQPDGFQVLTEPFYATFMILMSWATVRLFHQVREGSRWSTTGGCLLLVWFALSWPSHFVPFYRGEERSWSPEFERSVVSLIETDPPVVVALCSPGAIERFTEPRLRGGLAAHGLGTPLLWYRKPQARVINLSDPYLELSDDPQVRNFQLHGLQHQLLTRFAREKNLEVTEATIEAFLRHYKLRDVITDAERTVPSWLARYVEIELVDEKSGERYLKLKPW